MLIIVNCDNNNVWNFYLYFLANRKRMEELAVQFCDFVSQKEPQERKLAVEILGFGMYITRRS